MHIRSLSFLHDTFPKKDCYPFNLEVFRKTDTLVFSCPVTFFIGENGTGKSTLLRSIAHASQFHIWETQHGNRDSSNRFEGDLQNPSGSNGQTAGSQGLSLRQKSSTILPSHSMPGVKPIPVASATLATQVWWLSPTVSPT